MHPYKLIAVALPVGLIYIIWAQWGESPYRKNFKAFNAAEIEGVLEYVRIINHGAGFKLKESEEVFVFQPISGRETYFLKFAKPGDIVSKKAYSDILYLKKNDEVYEYTFDKPSLYEKGSRIIPQSSIVQA